MGFIITSEKSGEKFLYLYSKMRSAAAKYRSEALRHEADFLEVFLMPFYSFETYQARIDAFQQLAGKAGRRGDKVMRLRALLDNFNEFYQNEYYYLAFKQIPVLEEVMAETPDELYPYKKMIIYHIGELHYKFHDYDMALPYIWRCLKPSRAYYDYAYLKANNTLGLYHQSHCNLDSALYYYRSIINYPDELAIIPQSVAVAQTHIAEILYERRQNDSALVLLNEAAAAIKRIGDDPAFISRIYTLIGSVHLSQNNYSKTRVMIDSALYYAGNMYLHSPYKYLDIYRLTNRYYSHTGKSALQIAIWIPS